MTEELNRVRTLTLELQRLKQERAAMEPSLTSPKMDGMPHGHGGTNEVTEIMIDARAEMDDRIQALSAERMEAVRVARDLTMEYLPTYLWTVCELYYIAAKSVADVCRIIDRTEATFYRYKRELEGYDI